MPELSRAPAPSPPAGKPPWRVRAAAGQPFAARAASVFRHDAGSDVVLALVAGPEDPASWETLLTAAREAVTAERLVVVTASDGLAGFCASLHADHPSMGITLLQVPDTEQALQAASQFAGAEPGQLAELTLDSAGSPREQAMTAIDPAGGGTYPLGPADVILVSGMNSQPELACAASLACRGAALAVLAQPGPDDEPALAGLLAELRAAGRRVWCESADATDPDAVTAAVSELEAALGPVTAVVHGTAPAGRQPAAELDHQALRAHLAGQLARLATVLDCFEPARLRLLLTFGSVAQRYGTPGGCGDSLASAAVAGYAARRASTLPRCQALDVAWPPWPPGPGEVPVTERARLLRQMLATPGLPGHAAVHGRVGVPAPPSIRRGAGGPDPSGRFLETILVNYPGTELVADTRLTPRADPYLADYLMDGLSVLPAAMALEGMAQAAAAVAGQPLLTAGPVAMDAPVLIPGGPEGAGTVIRVCAVRRGSTVETVLRCAETGFRVDHARAVFRPGQPRPASGKAGPAARGSGAASSPGGVVDGTDLYGPVCFQSGRFRRVAFLPEVTSRSCRALVRGGDDQPWFGVPGEPAAPALVLGSAGLNDAALQVLQACLPHRRLLMAGCESVTVSGDDLRGALQVQARRSEQDAGGSGTAAAWDVTVLDVTGQPVVAWHRLRLHDAGPLARTGSWHPALLAASLEGRATELGLHPSLRVAVISGRVPVPVAAGASQAAGHGNADPDQDPGPGPGPGGQAGPGPGGQAEPGSGGQAEPGPGGQAEPGPGNWTSTADGRWLLDGLDLSVRAAVPVACQWQAVGQPESPGDTGDEGLAQLREQLLARPAEPAATAHARFRTIGSCLADLGRPPGEPLTLADACDHGWLVVRAASATVACAVVEISGVPGPAVISIATASPRAQAPAARPATPR